MIRYEDNRADKVFLKFYIKEIENAVAKMQGQNDISGLRDDFERNFANFIGGTKHVFSVASGTDALQLSLICLGVGKGDSVIIPDLSYISTALAVKYVGAEPIFVDVKGDDLTLDENKMGDALRDDTKAVIAVHMFGHPCDMDKINKIARKHNIAVIEDACQSAGSTYKGRRVGSFGELSAFSFSYYKPLSSLSGNGGVVAFNNPRYLDTLRECVNIWEAKKGLLGCGRKFIRMSLADLVSTNVKLRYFSSIMKSREELKLMYERGLEGLESHVKFFKDKKDTGSVMENYLILAEKRDKLSSYLKENGVVCDLPYPPFHSLNLFSHSSHKGKFPVSENYYKLGLHLPLYSFMKEEEVLAILSLVKRFYSLRSV